VNRVVGPVVLAALMIACAFAGWRIVAHTVADSAATTDPERALRWIEGHPVALLTLAERQLAAGEDAAAASIATRLLRAAPLEGRALRVLGEVADRAGDDERANALYEHAVILSPRDARSRRWLIRRDVTAGDHAGAVVQMDQLMRVSPSHRKSVLPLMAELARSPPFRDALVPALAADPAWRGAFLKELESGRHPDSAGPVAAALAQAGGLDSDERNRRIDRLIAQHEWGTAYATWASGLPAGTRLPLVHNGDFAHVPGNGGFDWRLRRVAGVQVNFVPQPEGDGLMAHVKFRRRPVATTGLEQPLLLGPGHYRLSVRMRAQGLQSQRGLEWIVQCAGGPVAGRSEVIDGTFRWRNVTADFEITPECNGQWLRLRNRVAKGSGQATAGELWIDDVKVTPDLSG